MERFWSHVDKQGSTPLSRSDLGNCWLWTAATTNGYGIFERGSGTTRSAHRISYAEAFGPIPEGFQLDHLCHDPEFCEPGSDCPHRRCVNPSHLQAVTPRDNTRRGGSAAGQNARKTMCVNGHPFDEANTRYRNGERVCRTCQAEYVRAHRQRKAAVRSSHWGDTSTEEHTDD